MNILENYKKQVEQMGTLKIASQRMDSIRMVASSAIKTLNSFSTKMIMEHAKNGVPDNMDVNSIVSGEVNKIITHLQKLELELKHEFVGIEKVQLQFDFENLDESLLIEGEREQMKKPHKSGLSN